MQATPYPFDDEEQDDRLTNAATQEQVMATLRDKAIRKVTLHKPGEVFFARVGGERQRFRVSPDGHAVREDRRRTKAKQPRRPR